MERSSKASSSGWSAAAGTYAANPSQGDSRQRPNPSAVGGSLMDLVASSSRTRAPQSASGLPPRGTVTLPYAADPPTNTWSASSGAGGASLAPMQPATEGSWRARVSGGGDRMGMGAESAGGSAWPAQQVDEPGSWRASLSRGDLGSVLAESARLQERQQFGTAGTLAFAGYGQDENAWPSSPGGGDLMSVVASAGRSARWPPPAAGTVRSEGEGLPWNSGSAAAGPSIHGQPALPPVTASAWPTNPSDGDLMSVVAASARLSAGQYFDPPGTASPMGSGLAGGGAQPSMPLDAPGDSSYRSVRAKPKPWLAQMSQAEFDAARSRVENDGLSAKAALRSIGREKIPSSSMRRWLALTGVTTRNSHVTSALSVAQIEAASRILDKHISKGGSRQGVVLAAYQELGDSSIKWSTFRDYFQTSGLSAYGRARLELARKSEAGGSGQQAG